MADANIFNSQSQTAETGRFGSSGVRGGVNKTSTLSMSILENLTHDHGI
jgi:hypothetical protein